MTTFEQQGYLSDDLPQVESTIRQTFGHAFGISLKVNAFAHTVLTAVVMDPDDLQRVLSLCLVLRLMEGHQSIHILSSRGLTVAAKVTLRSDIEALVLLKYVAQSADNFTRYVVSDQVQRRKWLNVIMRDASTAFSEQIRKGVSEELLAEIDQSISEFSATELKVEQLADAVGLHDLYQTAYRMLSYDVHVLPRSLEKYWVLDAQQQVVAMNFTPRNEDILSVLVPSMATTVNALGAFVTLLGTYSQYETQLGELMREIRGIGGAS